ncbi:hypothetical protein MKW94_010096 [Papaver nudicaule]|uniref:Bms1-type G domain-containing protein n=1 Tax=Papaver nudicaule TaxID=74823 RepID=A0AA41VMB3_PAPNU|nr:hypothetical protein [Papaver nudicaule]
MSISSASTTSSSPVYPPAFEIYRDNKRNNVFDGEIHDPPYIVLVQGPPNVGKSLLIKSLVKYFNSEHVTDDKIRRPITIGAGEERRLQFVECPDDINGMIDAAKYADAVLLLVDASYGFEAETFEFLNLLQVHGFPEVMGVLTHLDQFKDEKERKETIKCVEDNFWTEIYQGAKIYKFSGLEQDLYKMLDVQKLANAISMLQFRTVEHPYVLVDRFEDVTPPEKIHEDANCKRNLSLFGYLRGCNIKSGAKVHLAGVGDFCLAGIRSISDPFPISPEMEKEDDFVEQTNMENEIFKTGTYLRLEVCDVPFGMVENLDTCYPILVGGVTLEEENVGYMQARLKRHDWHMKLLKSGDLITVSAGWRRYQTKPIYAMEYDSEQHELAMYIPQYEHCLAMFWGPIAPPNTEIAVVQSNKEAFRITAKAVVLDPKDHSKIMKESKLKGKPCKILRSTALIKFTPDTDVAKFIGAAIKTKSGIRGQVNEAAKGKGVAKCTFVNRIDMSDIVSMPAVCHVVAPRFFDPSPLALEPCNLIENVDKDLLKTENLSQMRGLERRRGVKFNDGEPCDYSFLKYLMLPHTIENVRGRTAVVMSQKKRGVLTMKRKNEKREKNRKKFAQMVTI